MIDIHGFNSSIAVFDSEGSQHDSSIVSARAETGRDNQSRSSSRHNVIARPSGLPTIRPLWKETVSRVGDGLSVILNN